jgi:BirA family biotin operon repressor/biotin-[acetyl-CoA-carboxylase] ligase
MIYKIKRTESTNTLIRRPGFQAFDVLIAEEQDGGRGTGQRQFVSRAGGLYMSMLIPAGYGPPGGGPVSGYITPLAGCAAAELLSEYSIEAKIKWVNDLLVNGKKICGILAERFEKDDGEYIALGIGLNVNNDDFGAYSDIAVSMSLLTGKKYGLDELADGLISRLSFMIKTHTKERVIERYRDLSLVIGRYIATDSGERLFIGGIDGDGRLEAVTDDGQSKTVMSGSVRLID